VSRNNVIPSTHKPHNNSTFNYTSNFWIQVRGSKEAYSYRFNLIYYEMRVGCQAKRRRKKAWVLQQTLSKQSFRVQPRPVSDASVRGLITRQFQDQKTGLDPKQAGERGDNPG
jgi:hypothetical protein